MKIYHTKIFRVRK